MRYKNLKTGAVVDSPFVVTSDEWEAISVENLETKDLSHPELLQLITEKDQKIEELLVKIDELEEKSNAPEDAPTETRKANDPTITQDDNEYLEEEVDLNDLTNDKLEELAKEQGIKLTTADKKNKDTRIAAIVAGLE